MKRIESERYAVIQFVVAFIHLAPASVSLTLPTEHDIPDWFHKQLNAEELLKTKSKDKHSPAHGGTCPPINIVLLAQTPSSSVLATTSATAPGTPSSITSRYKRLDIPGPRDIAVRDYSEWHASKVDDNDLKNDHRKACQVALKNGLDLQQIFSHPDPTFFIER